MEKCTQNIVAILRFVRILHRAIILILCKNITQRNSGLNENHKHRFQSQNEFYRMMHTAQVSIRMHPCRLPKYYFERISLSRRIFAPRTVAYLSPQIFIICAIKQQNTKTKTTLNFNCTSKKKRPENAHIQCNAMMTIMGKSKRQYRDHENISKINKTASSQ